MNAEGSGSAKPHISEESAAVFREGISLVLSRWSALQLAVENEWGGRGSRRLADQLSVDIFSWFVKSTGEPLYIDDLEDILDETMQALNTMIQDGSIEEVSEKLMIMHEECLEGNYTSVVKLRQAGPQTGVHQHVRQAMDNDDDDDDDDADDDEEEEEDLETVRNSNGASHMMVDTPQFSSIPEQSVNLPVDEPRAEDAQAEDGWMFVSSKRNKGKRK